jgi:hypothetical protein
MKKRKPPKKTLRSDPIGDDFDVEMLYAAAEAHSCWEVMPDGTGIPTPGDRGAKYPTRAARMVLEKGQALEIRN